MKMIKCDRCKKTDSADRALNFGIASMYMAQLKHYVSPEAPIYDVDLCQKCYGELHGIVNDFMRAMND